MKGYIYRHWIINDKGIERTYIGQVRNRHPKHRWKDGGKGYLTRGGNSSTFARAITKYGWDNFNHDIILVIECDNEDELIFWLDEWEKYYIEKYDSFYNGYNDTTGGFNGKRSQKTKDKISQALKGHQLEEHTKRKISEKAKVNSIGNGNPMYGKHHSEETKQILRNRFKGRKLSEETKLKMKEARKNRPLTGGDNPSAKAVKCINTGQEFPSITEAAKWCGLKDKGQIGKNCKGKQKSAGKHPETGEKLQWQFI